MDKDFSEKLKSVLSDPAAMAKIGAIADSLGMGGSPNPSPAESSPPPAPVNEPPQIPQSLLPSPSLSSDPKIALLESLKPLIKEEKRNRLDSIEKALSVMTIMKAFRK